MPCYHPLQGWRGNVGESGKRSVVFRPPNGAGAESINLPCGQCVGCRLERSRQWAMRCLHESELYDRNCFVTLTYNNESLPRNGSLPPYQGGDFQLFMKRLRKAYPGDRIRFFSCGEYGEKLMRPHYHACLFNFDFDDKVLWSVRNGNKLFVSKSLDRTWGLGHCVIGDVTFESAAYVARYIMKKVTGSEAAKHYTAADGSKRKPEYTTMSRRPGIGADWYNKFKGDLYPHDFTVVRGVKVKPAKYYDYLYDLDNHVGMDIVRSDRAIRGMAQNKMKFDRKGRVVSENENGRLRAKEVVKLSAIKSLIRPMEDDNAY